VYVQAGLATHEAHFTILREEVFQQKGKKNEQSAQQIVRDSDKDTIPMKPLQFLHINVLREYLDADFSKIRNKLPFEYDLERIIDDFVFMVSLLYGLPEFRITNLTSHFDKTVFFCRE
jgi:5'-3' exonuclease